jgi:hypothetical protein
MLQAARPVVQADGKASVYAQLLIARFALSLPAGEHEFEIH